MFAQRFMDGTTVDEAYKQAHAKLMARALQAEEEFSLDELEAHADEIKATAAENSDSKLCPNNTSEH